MGGFGVSAALLLCCLFMLDALGLLISASGLEGGHTQRTSTSMTGGIGKGTWAPGGEMTGLRDLSVLDSCFE